VCVVTWGGYYSSDSAVIERYYLSCCLEGQRKSAKYLRYFDVILDGTRYIVLVSRNSDIFSKVPFTPDIKISILHVTVLRISQARSMH
jgi:hypothetical protein